MLLVLILVGMVFSTHTGDLTLREFEQKINNLDKLEQDVERLQKKVTTLNDKLETRNYLSFNRFTEIKEEINNSEAEITKINNQLEYGGKQYQSLNNLNSK